VLTLLVSEVLSANLLLRRDLGCTRVGEGTQGNTKKKIGFQYKEMLLIVLSHIAYYMAGRGKGLESNKTDAVENEFRERYSEQLRGKKQQVYNTQMGHHALDDERQQVNQQAMKTPGRRGEIIKNEEIDKEFSKRYREHKKP